MKKKCHRYMVIAFFSIIPIMYVSLNATCPVGSIAVDPDGVCINTLKVDSASMNDVLAENVTIQTLSVSEVIFEGGLDITAFTIAGIVHNDNAGVLSTSLIVNADIDATAAIADTKLATVSTTGKVANSATTATNANTSSTIVARDASGNFSAGTITANLSGNATTATTTTNAINFTGSLVGDVTGTQGATAVATIAGQTAANVAAATVLANAATTANTASAIVKRDASGNFSAGTITASLSGNASTATTTTNFSGSLVGDVTGTQNVTAVTTIGGQTAANVAAATVLTNAATNANTASTIIRRDSTGSFAAQVVSVIDTVASGNVVLSTNPSTSTTGNIMKGSNRFIHNTGTSNTFVGISSGNFTTSGTGQNSAFGVSALTANTTGNNNTACGYNALSVCTTGSNNIAMGSGYGGTLTTGSNNIYLGANAGTASESGSIRIGTSGTHNACFISSIGFVTLSLSATAVLIDTSTGKLGILVSSEKFKRDIKDMDNASSDILKLRPVNFVYKEDELNTQQFGLIAEEVDKAFPALVIYDENGEPKSVQYHILPVLLLNEMKKQQEVINAQQNTINNLCITVETVGEAMNSLQVLLQECMMRVKVLENRV